MLCHPVKNETTTSQPFRATPGMVYELKVLTPTW